MSEQNLFYLFVSRLNAAHINYMVTGAAASIICGEPRLTHDIDIVVEINKEHLEQKIKQYHLTEVWEQAKKNANSGSKM